MSATLVGGLIREGVLPIAEIPGLQGYTHESISRWVRQGRRSLSGRVVRLEAVRHPKEWRTSEAAVARFFAALAEESAEVACV